MEYNIDQKIDVIASDFVEYVFEDDILLLAPKKPAWLLVNRIQYKIYENLSANKSISESIDKVFVDCNLSKEQIIKELQVMLSMCINNGFMKNTHTEERKFEKELVIYLTENCNIKCRHCFIEAEDGRSFLPQVKIRQYLNEYAKIKPNGKILLTGGEPFLHPDFGEIISYGFKKGLKISINTNGTLLTETWLENYGQMIYGLQISIDGFNSKIHDNIRGKGNFQKSWRMVKTSAEILPENVMLRLSVSVFPDNVEHLKGCMLGALELVDPSRRIAIVLNPVAPLGRAEESQSSSYAMISEELTDTLRLLDESGWNMGSDLQSSIKQKKCGIGEYIVLRSNGKMAPCNFSSELFTFETLREGFEFYNKKYKNCNVDNSEICSECDVRYICFGGCQVVNALKGGDILKPICDDNRVRSVLSTIVADERMHRKEIVELIEDQM